MKVKITRNAAKVIQTELDKPENEGLKLRVFITNSHGDHVHYGMDLGQPEGAEELVSTDKEIDVAVDPNESWLDGIKIDYLYLPEEGFVITNPSKGNHGDH
ncbi:Fe-S cluster assembly iron-binding protein IscA [Paenibacillus sp. SORGH_AS306]|uniref:iron-sulfur cluster assembly accessory protein n=1 Tax=unclassified Paenibacillus TaxID=185978 RepID=UPI00278A1D40|nr:MULTISPECIES: iron-sulfur cluster assembly accessory protein [unclassified Paenibacillus]MDQ1233437.1 Fe-S cluster assembly iron-binding protein IscA [Paenibacillus sp. SORGH_AS_0306]MDR6110477.1 Fe-S cluster assembly iron-binding protein IscA [Paenibacillus sp. SORGH_AS_0338]